MMDLIDSGLTQPSKLLLLAALLAKDNVISQNSKSFLKELALRRDERLISLLADFESQQTDDAIFLQKIHDAIEQESEVLYKDIFHDTPTDLGKQLSREERHAKGLDEAKSLIYGEVEYHSFYHVLRKINPSLLYLQLQTDSRRPADAGFVFYDLGSGTGKAVILARILYDFSVCVGVELLQKLYTQSKVIEQRFNEQFRPSLTAGRSQAIEMHEDSILDFDWSDGDVVFANSTCFDDDLMEAMSVQADQLAPGAIFVTFTKGLSSAHRQLDRGGVPSFELLDRKRYKMSWGPATVFIHRRLEADGSSVADDYRLSFLPCDAVCYDDDTSLASVSDEEEEEEEDSRSYEDDDIIRHHYSRQTQGRNSDRGSDSDEDQCSDESGGEEAEEEEVGGISPEEYAEMYAYYKQLKGEKRGLEEDSDSSDSDSDYVPSESDAGSSEYEESESEESMTGSSGSGSYDSQASDNYDDDDDDDEDALYRAYSDNQRQQAEAEAEAEAEARKHAYHAAETHRFPTHEQQARAVFHDNETHYPPRNQSQTQSPPRSPPKQQQSPSRSPQHQSPSKSPSAAPAVSSPYNAPSFVSPTRPLGQHQHLPSAISTHGHHNMHHVKFSPQTTLDSGSGSGSGQSPAFMNSPMDAALLKRKHAPHVELDQEGEGEDGVGPDAEARPV